MTIEDTLKRSDVFLGLNDSDLEIIARLPSSRLASFQIGQFLFKAGEEAKNIYVIEEGQINVIAEVSSSTGKTNIITIDIVSKGSLLGWSALVRPHLYVLSAVCQKPCELVIINGNELLSLFEQNCIIGYRVLQGLSHVIGVRFRDLQQILITGKRWPFIEKHFYT
jgi:CRP/FNR family cyclic AMP-dependent transcriptional regulator